MIRALLFFAVCALDAYASPRMPHSTHSRLTLSSGAETWNKRNPNCGRRSRLLRTTPNTSARWARPWHAKKLDESSRCFEKALQLNPNDSATRRNLASNQFQTGKLGPARRNLEMVLRANSEDKTAVLLLGMVAEELGDYTTAIQRLEICA